MRNIFVWRLEKLHRRARAEHVFSLTLCQSIYRVLLEFGDPLVRIGWCLSRRR